MTDTLFNYIATHGYTTIFLLVVLAELGVPNPVPNELILVYVGTLAASGTLELLPAFLVAVAADFIGTSILYSILYLCGEFLVSKNFKWFPRQKIESFSRRISERGKWGIFIGRLLPYLRGYASVAAGLLRIPPKVFLSVVILSAMLWSGGYVLLGYFIGPHLKSVMGALGLGQAGIFVVLAGTLILFVISRQIVTKRDMV